VEAPRLVAGNGHAMEAWFSLLQASIRHVPANLT